MTTRGPVRAAIVLAGGGSARMGTDKLALERAGVSLLDTVLLETRRRLDDLGDLDEHPRLIVVGPGPRASMVSADYTREEPPGAGPVAALAAGIALLRGDRLREDNSIDEGIVIVLAGDAPAGPTAMPLLLDAVDSSVDGAVRVDAAVLVNRDGRRQPLCAAYRLDSLDRALTQLGDPAGRGMGELMRHLEVVEVADLVDAADDLDTPADAARWGFSPPAPREPGSY